MKILVIAFRLDADRTSAGICTTNLIRAFRELGHQVTVLTPPWYTNSVEGQVASLPFAQRIPSTRHRLLAWIAESIAPDAAPTRRRVIGKLEALLNYTTGRGSSARLNLSAWRASLRAALNDGESTRTYDLVLLCSAGTDFTVPIALLEEYPPSSCSTPRFVTHYHDPFPTSLYPPPYRESIPLISRFQEADHRRILRGSPALSFPSERLRDWVVGEDHGLRAKSVCLPHPAIGPSEPLPAQLDPTLRTELDLPEQGMVVVHTGSLLSPRSPFPLFEAWRQFVAADPRRQELARLVHVGGVHRRHLISSWRDFAAQPTYRLLERRISYLEAMTLCRDATAAVVLEAPAALSPFYPGKLADLLWLDQVTLGLSPRESVVADALGSEHPLLARPDDVAGIRAALEQLWSHWQRGELDALRPSRSGRNLGALERVSSALESLRETLRLPSST